MELIKKADVLSEIDKIMAEEMSLFEDSCAGDEEISSSPCVVYTRMQMLRATVSSLGTKEVDIEKMCNFKRSVGLAFPDSASEYQKYLSCYRQRIEDVLKVLKGE